MRATIANHPWRPGNRAELLENGEAFFPRAFEAISRARREILLETFILFEDEVGTELRRRIIEAARRGVKVEMTVDGYGSHDLSEDFLSGLTAAGVEFRIFDPRRTLFGLRVNVFRRMHRKLLVVDGERAFVGGINYGCDHLETSGPASKQDYALEVEGPVVADIREFVAAAMHAGGDGGTWFHRSASPSPAPGGAPGSGEARALFLVRDNGRNSTAIEREYRAAIRAAQHEIVIANAYFFPGYGFMRELRDAARRGVRVSLITQGEPDMPFAQLAARMLYPDLVAAGVVVYEYCRRPFHGKVALIDDDWATVGSSNLDPLSLSLNLEANVFLRDHAMNQRLRRSLDALRRSDCRRIEARALPRRSPWRTLIAPLFYHAQRRFPAWAGLLPAHTPKVVRVASDAERAP
ncbi:cardiolipin synthase ClsB [Luteimonas sp. SJ-92]|uniref:Cardiolipin synthase B n=1 Tax=Luteimonas salinisoli TaxID=2752307 RepID=A0A853JCK4_9GAMM|nr:cardiolipin synthase ClsB [Luteimonas salinisoli]NZA27006.1 cardiolipin synthase ClsB [Luteimonas salinisoli]